MKFRDSASCSFTGTGVSLWRPMLIQTAPFLCRFHSCIFFSPFPLNSPSAVLFLSVLPLKQCLQKRWFSPFCPTPKADVRTVEFGLRFGRERPLTLPLLPFVAPLPSPPHPPAITALRVPALGVSPALGVGHDLLFTCE